MMMMLRVVILEVLLLSSGAPEMGLEVEEIDCYLKIEVNQPLDDGWRGTLKLRGSGMSG